MNATPAKLKSGRWGARVVGSVEPGQEVIITTRSGKSWTARVERVVWTGDGISLCETSSTDGRGGGSGRTGGGGGRSGGGGGGSGRLVGSHTNNPCSCGNWSGPGSPCLYSYGEAKDEGEHRNIIWQRQGA